MIHHYVERPKKESHGSWSVAKGRSGVLVQITAGVNQTRIAIPPDEALRLAQELMEIALKAMKGLAGQRGNRRTGWYIEVGRETAPGISDEVILEIHDAEGKNGDIRTSLALPIDDVLEMIEEVSRRALQVARDHRADALSRHGRSSS